MSAGSQRMTATSYASWAAARCAANGRASENGVTPARARALAPAPATTCRRVTLLHRQRPFESPASLPTVVLLVSSAHVGDRHRPSGHVLQEQCDLHMLPYRHRLSRRG